MFLVVGKGVYTKEALVNKLNQWGITNPLSVVREAEERRTYNGRITIMAVR